VIEPRPRVAAVVLNWNALEETLACLGSLAASDWPGLTTIAVDNASSQDISAAVSESFPEAVVIRNPANLGFAGGMNVGLRRALALGADYVLLLNNDTLVDAAMVRLLVQAAEAHPDAGIVCPVVLWRDAPDVVLSAGLRCDLRRGYQGRAIAMGERVTDALTSVRAVDAPSGAAMLVSADVVRRIGMLDEQLFLYGEDVEWSQRMLRHGLRVYVAADARLWHGLSVSSGGAFSPVGAYYQTRNSFVVCARYAPLRGPRSLLRSADILLANLAHTRRARHPLLNVRAVLAGWRDYLLGRLGPCPVELHPPPAKPG
jgi:hypothetical protein